MSFRRTVVVVLSFICGVASAYFLAKYAALPGYFLVGLSVIVGLIFALAVLTEEKLIPPSVDAVLMIASALAVALPAAIWHVSIWRICLVVIGAALSAVAALFLFGAVEMLCRSKKPSDPESYS